MSCIYWPTIFKRGGLKFWAEFSEKFGAPWIIGREPRSNTDQDTDRLLDALEQLIGNSVATIPDDSSVEIKEAAGKQGSADVYEKDSTHASATAGLEVTKDIRDNDCRIVEGCLNQLIDWICGFNFAADTPRPQFVLYTEEAGDKTLAERDQILTGCGVRLSESYWKRAYNLSDDDIVQVASPPNATPASPWADFAEHQPAADVGLVIDTLAPLSGSLNAQGQALTDILIGSLKQGAVTPEAVLDRLTAAYPNMDDAALQEELARLIFLAELVGRVEAAEELAE